MTSACMHIMACTHQVIIMSTGKLSLPESSFIVLIVKTVPSTWHRHHSFIDIVRSFIVTRLVTVKSGDRQVITTGDRHRHRQVRRPASYHYRRPASFIVKSSRTRD